MRAVISAIGHVNLRIWGLRSSAIADSITAVDAAEPAEGETRVERVRTHLADHHGLALSDRLPRRMVEEVLRVGSTKLTELGLPADAQRIVDRGALVEYLRSVSSFGPHYSPAPA